MKTKLLTFLLSLAALFFFLVALPITILGEDSTGYDGEGNYIADTVIDEKENRKLTINRLEGKRKEFIEKIKKTIRSEASPRHVPAKIIEVSDIPRTKNGKIVELAVKNIIEGKLKDSNLHNSQIHLMEDGLENENYENFLKDSGNKYDIIILDAFKRYRCSVNILNSLKKGGIIILDDSERWNYERIFDHYKKLGLHKLDFEGISPGQLRLKIQGKGSNIVAQKQPFLKCWDRSN